MTIGIQAFEHDEVRNQIIVSESPDTGRHQTIEVTHPQYGSRVRIIRSKRFGKDWEVTTNWSSGSPNNSVRDLQVQAMMAEVAVVQATKKGWVI